jgi:hypothetical protein
LEFEPCNKEESNKIIITALDGTIFILHIDKINNENNLKQT